MSLYIFPVTILSLAVVSLFKSMIIIKQDCSGVRERLGRFIDTLKPGLHFVIPFLDTVHLLSAQSEVYSVPGHRISGRDGKAESIDIKITARITDASKAYYAVANLEDALTTAATVKINDLVKNNSLSNLGVELNRFESEIHKHLSDFSDGWGVKLESIKLEKFSKPE